MLQLRVSHWKLPGWQLLGTKVIPADTGELLDAAAALGRSLECNVHVLAQLMSHLSQIGWGTSRGDANAHAKRVVSCQS